MATTEFEVGDKAVYPAQGVAEVVGIDTDDHTITVENERGEILLERRPPTGIWGGLWSLPEFDDAAAMEQWLASRLGVLPPAEALAPVDHAFTHFHLRIHPRRVVVEAFDTMADGNGHDWCTRARSPGGMPAPVRRLADTLMAEPLA